MSGAERYPVERLVPHDPSWASRYADLAGSLRAALGPDWRIEHVGSTSVPGLSAKPVIDLALGQPHGHDIRESIPTFRRLGWSEPIVVGNHLAIFKLDGDTRRAIAHVFSNEQWDCAHVRLFAEWLRDHASDRDEYERLKGGLVAAGVWGDQYTRCKADFVVRVVNKAREGGGLPPVSIL